MTLDLGTVNDRLTILNEYIGKPYLVNGRGPDVFDCYGLVIDIYRRLFDIHLPDWTVEDATLATAVRVINKAWRSQEANDLAYKVDEPEDFDIAFLYRKDIAHHVGIYVNGGVIPVVYGSVRQNPDYASQPYTSFDEVIMTSSAIQIDNIERNRGDGDQYLFYLLALGQGRHRIDDILLGATSTSLLTADTVDKFDATQDVHQNRMGNIEAGLNSQIHIGPQFYENVITSIEVGSLDLVEPHVTPYFPIGVDPVRRISLDFSFRRGFYKTNDRGGFETVAVNLLVYVKNAAGTLIIKDITFSSSVANVSEYRRTVSFDVPSDVYSISIERKTPKADPKGRIADVITWVGSRGVIQNTNASVYGNTHLLAMRIKATNLISQAATSRVNVRLTRMLDNLNHVQEYTSNPADIVADIMRNKVYGARRPDAELDVAQLQTLKTHWGGAATAYGFNGVFNGDSTIFEALRVSLGVVGAEPLALGSYISVAADGKKAMRTQVYTEANMLMNSFAVNYNFDRAGSSNGVQVEFRDSVNWQPDFATYPPNATDPELVQLFGCTSKDHASKYARLIWQRRLHQRKTTTFETELEGLIPRPGDRIAVSHTLANWGQSGLVVSYDPATKELATTVELDFSGVADKYVTLRNLDGTPLSPIKATIGPRPSVCVLASDPPLNFGDLPYNQIVFSFGDGARVTKDFVVSSIRHNGGVTTTVEAQVYDERVYDNTFSFMGVAL